MKNIVLINSTFRKGGNSEALGNQFAQGAKDSGNKITTVYLRDLDLKYCIGCLSCLKTGKCIHNDGVNDVLPLIQGADILVFSTPIYYYCICGQLKTFLDRLNPLYGQKNKFKKVYLLTTAADTDQHAMDGAIKAIQGWIDCFDGVELSGVVFGGGADALGSVQKTTAFTKAYEMGKAIF